MTDEKTVTIVVEVVHDGDTFINQCTAAYNNTIYCYILLQKLVIGIIVTMNKCRGYGV